MSRPWMPLYIDDYRGATSRLSTVEHGAYLLLIMEYWRAGGLPDDDKQLARITGMRLEHWRKIRSSMQHFFYDGWKHKRIDDEIAHCVEISEKRRAAVEERENKRRSNDASNDTSNDDTLHTSHFTKKEDDDEDAGVKSPLVSEESNSLADEIATIVGHDLRFVPPAWYGASYVAQKWLSSGWKREIILASVREQMARRNGDPPDRITYFEKGIAGAHARHEAPLPAGTPERPHAKTGNGNIIPAADRLIERIRAFDRQIPDAAGGRSGAGSAPVRLLSTGGRE